MVEHFERVAELEAEAPPALIGKGSQTRAQLHRFLKSEAGSIGGRIHMQLAVTEHIVEHVLQSFPAEHRRVHFDDHVEIVITDQEFADTLDFISRAAVERGQGYAAGNHRGIRKITRFSVCRRNLRAQAIDDVPRIAHAVEEAADLVAADAGQVIAHADVVNHFAGRAGELTAAVAAIVSKHLDEHGPRNVFAQRVLNSQFLRPFDVVADIGHVDARPGNGQAVIDLHGLEFKDPAAGDVAEQDILGHLRVRPGGGADRIARKMAVEAHREIRAVRRRYVPLPPRQLE